MRETFHSSSILIKVSPSERYVNCICSLDLIDKVSLGNLFRVLRERLPLVDRLHKIIYASHGSFGAELMFSFNDLKQWKVIYWNLRSMTNLCIFMAGRNWINCCLAVLSENGAGGAWHGRDEVGHDRVFERPLQPIVHQPRCSHAHGGPHHFQ